MKEINMKKTLIIFIVIIVSLCFLPVKTFSAEISFLEQDKNLLNSMGYPYASDCGVLSGNSPSSQYDYLICMPKSDKMYKEFAVIKQAKSNKSVKNIGIFYIPQTSYGKGYFNFSSQGGMGAVVENKIAFSFETRVWELMMINPFLLLDADLKPLALPEYFVNSNNYTSRSDSGYPTHLPYPVASFKPPNSTGYIIFVDESVASGKAYFKLYAYKQVGNQLQYHSCFFGLPNWEKLSATPTYNSTTKTVKWQLSGKEYSANINTNACTKSPDVNTTFTIQQMQHRVVR